MCHDSSPIDWEAFSPGITLAMSELPRPATAPGRPGVGFIIAHQGPTENYLVLGWWDRENELPLRVFVSPNPPLRQWRRNETNESICVWDIEILWNEREAYVSTMLNPAGENIAAYLARAAGTPQGLPPGGQGQGQ